MLTDTLVAHLAVVLGAAGRDNMGQAIARRFKAEGARVVVADIHADAAEAAAQAVRAAGAPDAAAAACDVSKQADAVAAVSLALQRWGRLDVVVNNAGKMIFKPLEEHSEADFLDVLRVDLLGAFFFTQQAFLHMRGSGAVVNVSSVHAVETTPLVSAYAAAKAALTSRSSVC